MGFGTVLGLTAALIGLETGAELLLKPSQGSTKYDYRFFIGVIIYVAVAVVFGVALRSDDAGLAVINTVWQATNIAAIFVISIVFLKETPNWWDYVGAGLAFTGAMFMAVPAVVSDLGY